MKQIIQTTILLLFVAACGQPVKVNIDLYLQDCKDKMAHWHESDTLVLHKLPEDTVEREITVPYWLDTKIIKIQDLPVSAFRLTFKNSFGQKISKQISTTSKPTQAVYVCIDSLQTYKPMSLARLQVGDSVVVVYNFNSDYNWVREKLVLLKTNSGLLAKLYGANGQTTEDGPKLSKPTLPVLRKTQLLNDGQAAAFTRFENELDHIRPDGSSINEQYQVKSKYGHIQKNSGTYDWWGFDFLKKTFFGKET